MEGDAENSQYLRRFMRICTQLTLIQWIELKLCQVSATIREKPNWWIKMRDPTISAKWKSEISEQQKDLPLDRQLSTKMVWFQVHSRLAYRLIAKPD